MFIRRMKRYACAFAAVALIAPSATATSVQINFSGGGGNVTGAGSPLVQSLFNSTLFSGMFVIRNFNPIGFTGTVSFDGQTSDDGVEFLLHLSTLEAIEGAFLRTGPDPRSDELDRVNRNIIVPRTAAYSDAAGTGFFGAGSVTFINGVLVGFEYSIGPEALASYDFLFDNANVDASLETILISSGQISRGAQFIVDGADPNANTAYGLNTGNYEADGTDNTTTRFEASDPELCSLPYINGICVGSLDPFNADIGLNPFVEGQDLFQYTLSGLTTEVTTVPLPAGFWLLGSALAGLFLRRK
ncbi:MAG: VPLPA-CTERM sorting domain-containing protein [Pseudomonadota bacterium]